MAADGGSARGVSRGGEAAAGQRGGAGVRLRAHELYFRSGGERLFFRAWQAPASRATLVVVHGIGEHSGRHARLGRALREAGVTTVAFDLRGHGRSGGRPGHVERFEDHVEDLAVFRRVVEALVGPGPRFLLGHSLGGLVAVQYLLRRRPDDLAGVVLSSPALRLRVEPGEAKLRFVRLLERLLPAVAFPNQIRPEHLTHDHRIAEEYATDPLIRHRSTPRTFLETLRAMAEARERAAEVTWPLLVLGGTDDRVVSPEAARDFVQRASSPDKRLVLYPALYHEVFHEPERARVRGELLRWLAARIR